MTKKDGKEEDHEIYLKEQGYTQDPLNENKWFKDMSYRVGDLNSSVQKIRIFIRLDEKRYYIYDIEGKKKNVPDWIEEKIKLIATRAVAMVDGNQLIFSVEGD